jgi:general secretion pathway protein D
VKRTIPALLLAASLCAVGQIAFAQQALNLQMADIRAFIEDVARVTGRTFIIDPRVQGNVSISSNAAIGRDELLDVLFSALRANGLIAVPVGDSAYRVLPDQNAAQQPTDPRGSVGFATEVYRLNSIDAAAAMEVLRPLVGPQGVVVATPQGNTLVVADYTDNLDRVRTLLDQIDQDRTTIEVISLRNSSAREVIAAVNQLVATPGQQGAARSTRIALAPVESSNSIVLRGDPTLVQSVLAIITDLDRRAASTDDVRVVRLQHANAATLLPVLQQLIGQTPTVAANGQSGETALPGPIPAAPPGAAVVPALPGLQAQPGRSANIALFEGANALVISADPETQRILADVIRQLDTRREQVLVEAIVVEASDDTAKALGVQFLLGRQDRAAPFFATNYSNSAPSILALTGAIAGGNVAQPNDGNLQALRAAAIASLVGTQGALAGGAGTSNGLLFGMIINAVRSDATSNILSTPSVMTLDNESASLLVGQEVPITTGEVLGVANTNPFRTVQREDVGVQLEVKPQINADGAITLVLRQEVSSVAGPVGTGSSELILNKREIQTTVLVDDGDIIVLGGLLDQNDRLQVDRVPGLGDIPLVGALFRSNTVDRTKRNLMVFIRPTIVRNPADAQNVTAPRYDFIRNLQTGGRPGARSSLDEAVQNYLRANPPVPVEPNGAAR